MAHWALALGEVEELALCSCCKRAFDDAERAPKLLACRHHFCLACARTVLAKGRELYCVHCWKRTELPDGRVEALPTHAPVLALARRLHAPPPIDSDTCAVHALPALWCTACSARACRACGEHAAHALAPPGEARALLTREAAELRSELARLRARRREAVLRALDAATALKTKLEVELAAPDPPEWRPVTQGLPALAAERERLRTKLADAALQTRLDELVRSSPAPLDGEQVSRALATPATASLPVPLDERRDSTLLLANHCLMMLFTRQWTSRPRPALTNGGETSLLRVSPAAGEASPLASPAAPLARSPAGAHPLFYFNLEVDGCAFGRVVVEVRADAAPRMARNFSVLCSGELGVGYRGCAVFQCWDGESVITGDFELNNGRGGRSVFEESYFMPDDTGMAAVRGAVGMRRSQKRHDNLGLVGSQFRIMLREMRGFTAIFGFVVEGLELVDRLSRTGDSAGKPHASILIASCGKLN